MNLSKEHHQSDPIFVFKSKILLNFCSNIQLEMPLAKAYPAGGNVMVDNLWYKDAQEGIQVKPKVTIL